MQFVNPIWLWGLAGLLIPIGIHLLSRREGKIIKIGSIRHLEETNSKQFKSIRLNEIVLLLLRCSLITILVLLLSGIHFRGFQKSGRWLVIENGLEHEEQFSALIDSLRRNGFEMKSLAQRFPALRNSSKYIEETSYWNLLGQLEKRSLNEVVVLAYNYAEGFTGKRISLPENVHWISKSPAPTAFGVNAIRLLNDSIRLRTGYSNPDETWFSTTRSQGDVGQRIFRIDESDSILIEPPETVSVQIVNDSTFGYDTKILAAALRAIDDNSPDDFNIETTAVDKFSPDDTRDWVFWLSHESPGRMDVNCIYYQGKSSNALFEQTGLNLWALTQRLNEQIALDKNLTVELGLILTSEKNHTVKAKQNDRRVLPDKLIWSTNQSNSRKLQARLSTFPGDKYLIGLLLLVLLFERWMAFKRNQ